MKFLVFLVLALLAQQSIINAMESADDWRESYNPAAYNLSQYWSGEHNLYFSSPIIDPSQVRGAKTFLYQAATVTKGYTPCFAIENQGGVLRVSYSGILNTELERIYHQNSCFPEPDFPVMEGTIDIGAEWYSMVSTYQMGTLTCYAGKNRKTKGDAVTVVSDMGVDLCNAVFEGPTTLILKGRGDIPNPIFSIIVEPLEAASESFFDRFGGGAMASGTLEFVKSLEDNGLKGNCPITPTNPNKLHFVVVASFMAFSIKGTGQEIATK